MLPTNTLLSFCFQIFLLPSRRHIVVTPAVVPPLSSPPLVVGFILPVCQRLLQGVAVNAEVCVSFLPFASSALPAHGKRWVANL